MFRHLGPCFAILGPFLRLLGPFWGKFKYVQILFFLTSPTANDNHEGFATRARPLTKEGGGGASPEASSIRRPLSVGRVQGVLQISFNSIPVEIVKIFQWKI